MSFCLCAQCKTEQRACDQAGVVETFGGAAVDSIHFLPPVGKVGLASAMVALVLLYWTAGIFVYGGEFNQAIRRARRSVAEL